MTTGQQNTTDGGREAAELHWLQGFTWNEIAEKLEGEREGLRSAARAYKDQHPGDFPTDSDQISTKVAGNYATVKSKSSRITSLEQLLEASETDLSVWRVKDHEITKWEVGARPAWKDLTFDEGKITGTIREEGLLVEPLWRIKAELVRVDPEPLHPTIRPVQCRANYVQAQPPQIGGIQRSLVFADSQVGFSRDVPSAGLTPFHDRRAMDIVLQVAEEAQPDRVDILGDYLDFVMWTDKFLRSPKFEYTTQPAILEAHWWLSQLRDILPEARITLHEGNHEARMKAAIMTHLRAAYGLKAADEMHAPPAMSPQKLLALDSLAIEWKGHYPDDGDWLNDAVQVSHGAVARTGPGATVARVVQNSDCTKIIGHAHRLEWGTWTTETRRGSVPRVAFCPGCTCHIDWRVPGHKPGQKWQQGLAVVDFEIHQVGFGIAPILIDRGQALWNGKMFHGRDRVPDLRADLPDWNW